MMKDTDSEELPLALIRIGRSSIGRMLGWLFRPVSPRGWLWSVGVSIAFLLLVIGVFNYTVDSKLFFLSGGTKEVIRQGAENVMEGRAVVLLPIDNLEQRFFQRCVIEAMDAPRECVVLGSSRVQFVSSGSLGMDSREVFNHSIPASGIKDMVAVLGMYRREHGRYPDRIILGLDPWMFEPYETEFRWVSALDDYRAAAGGIWASRGWSGEGILAGFLYARKVWRLVDWGYTRDNLKALIKGESKSRLLLAVDPRKVDEVPYHVIYPDGSREWAFPREPDGSVSAESAGALGLDHAASRKPDFGFQDKRLRMLRDVIRHLQESGVEVQVLIPPMHPDYIGCLGASDYLESLRRLDAQLVDLCGDLQVERMGGFTAIDGLGPGDFFDSSHPAKWVYDRLLSSISGNPSSSGVQDEPSD